MKDFNFFSPYKIVKKEKTDRGKLIITSTSILLVGAISLVSGFQFIEMSNLKKTKLELEAIMEDPQFMARYKEAQTKMNTLKDLEAEETFFVLFQDNITSIHKVNEYIMNFIAKKMVKDSFLVNLNIKDKEIILEGRALNKKIIAQFEDYLRKSNMFEEVFVSEITKSENVGNSSYYDFKISLLSRG